MNIASIIALLIPAVLTPNAQSPSTTNPVSATSATNQSTSYSIVARGPHHRVWERTEYENTPSGKVVPHVHRYTDLASGLHYWDTNSSAWQESSEQIQSVPGGAAALSGQYQVHFPYDLSAGVIET